MNCCPPIHSASLFHLFWGHFILTGNCLNRAFFPMPMVSIMALKDYKRLNGTPCLQGGPAHGLMICCQHLEILNILTCPKFVFFIAAHKLCNQSFLALYMLFSLIWIHMRTLPTSTMVGTVENGARDFKSNTKNTGASGFEFQLYQILLPNSS